VRKQENMKNTKHYFSLYHLRLLHAGRELGKTLQGPKPTGSNL